MVDYSHLDEYYLHGDWTIDNVDREEYDAWKDDYLRNRAKRVILPHMPFDEDRLNRLESQVREQAQIIDKLQNMLRIAGNYQNEDLDSKLNGVQAALLKAGEVKARNGGRRR